MSLTYDDKLFIAKCFNFTAVAVILALSNAGQWEKYNKEIKPELHNFLLKGIK